MDKERNMKWEVLSSDYISHEPWFTVRKESVKLPNGNILTPYYVMEYPNWINVNLYLNGNIGMELEWSHMNSVPVYAKKKMILL